MTIASEISNLQTNLANSYDVIEEKGGTLPQAQNFDNLASAINSIVLKREVGEVVESILPLNSATYHLLDGALISGNGIYSDFVDYIAGLYGDGTNIPAYFVNESTWQNSVATYGVCGKFVYDSTNNTVRLPKITGILEGTTDANALGDLVEAGLPNITGNIVLHGIAEANIIGGVSGCIEGVGGDSNNYRSPLNLISTSGSLSYGAVGFDASRSSSIYGNSNTVQPQTIKAYYYIVLASSTKTDIQVDIDNIVTDLNNKVSKTDNETIGGTKTFSVSPIVPTATAGDSSTKAANTAFVASAVSNLQTQVNTKANDADVVHKTGNETITGSKTFTRVININGTDVSGLLLNIPGVQWASLNIQPNGLGPYLTTGDFSKFVPLFCGNSYGANSVITNLALSHNATGGTLLGNGIRINWGVTANSSSRGETCTFAIPFETTNYAVAFSQPYAGWSTQAGPSTYNYTTTTFDCIYQGETGYLAHWIAIGH